MWDDYSSEKSSRQNAPDELQALTRNGRAGFMFAEKVSATSGKPLGIRYIDGHGRPLYDPPSSSRSPYHPVNTRCD
jgi:hypothetical protein